MAVLQATLGSSLRHAPRRHARDAAPVAQTSPQAGDDAAPPTVPGEGAGGRHGAQHVGRAVFSAWCPDAQSMHISAACPGRKMLILVLDLRHGTLLLRGAYLLGEAGVGRLVTAYTAPVAAIVGRHMAGAERCLHMAGLPGFTRPPAVMLNGRPLPATVPFTRALLHPVELTDGVAQGRVTGSLAALLGHTPAVVLAARRAAAVAAAALPSTALSARQAVLVGTLSAVVAESPAAAPGMRRIADVLVALADEAAVEAAVRHTWGTSV